jgi:hypothetical protein
MPEPPLLLINPFPGPIDSSSTQRAFDRRAKQKDGQTQQKAVGQFGSAEWDDAFSLPYSRSLSNQRATAPGRSPKWLQTALKKGAVSGGAALTIPGSGTG